MNYNVKIDLKKLEKVAVMNIQGKNGLIKCVVIPVEENNIFISDKPNGGILLNLKASETREMRYGQSHILKRTFSKDVYSKMTKEDLYNMPIVGNLSPYNGQGMEASQTQATETKVEQEERGNNIDELPF